MPIEPLTLGFAACRLAAFVPWLLNFAIEINFLSSSWRSSAPNDPS